MENKFNEEDKKKVIEFLNLVALKANFTMNTQEMIKYYGLLTFMQKTLIPKIEHNYLEIVEVIESEDKE